MSSLFTPQIGAVLSADIAVPEHARELRFYKQVLVTGDTPLWGHHGANNLGMPVLGLGARIPAFEHLPLQWMPHIQVADVSASAARALELGGTEVMHSRNAAGDSEWAVLSDANGAAFGIIPVVDAASIPASARGASAHAAVGRIQWLDLTIADADGTRDFYRQVVGWSVQDVPMADGDKRYADYNLLGADGTPSAGICHARGVNTGLPPVWMLYVTVGDLEESVRRVEPEGGVVLKSMRGEGGAYTYAAIQDPVGVCIALVQG